MKQTILACILIVSGAMTQAQTDKFTGAMQKALTELESDSTYDMFMSTANKFERIALAEKTQWLPYYYAAYARCVSSFITTDKSKVDEIMDGAQVFADKADSLMPKNSEIFLIKSMILSGRIMVDPMSRGMQYGMQSSSFITQAMQLDPENPRAYLMMGQALYYTPEQFGGGVDKACVMLQQSMAKYATFTPESTIHPDWGEEMMLQLVSQCVPADETPTDK